MVVVVVELDVVAELVVVVVEPVEVVSEVSLKIIRVRSRNSSTLIVTG